MTTIDENILKWAQGLPKWQNFAFLKIMGGEPVTEDDLLRFVEMVKVIPGADLAVAKATFEVGSEGAIELKLISIGEIEGVEDLKPRQPLRFSKSALTLVYGSNGAGKSGYVRLLKTLSGQLPVDSLRTNVFKGPVVSRTCSLEYSIADKPVRQSINLLSDIPIHAFREISFFDSENGRVYLSKDRTATFVPRVLSIFDELVQVCIKVKGILVAEQNALVSRLPTLPSHFTNTKIGAQYRSLEGKVAAEIEELIKWSKEKDERLKQIDLILVSKDPAELAIAYTKQARNIEVLQSKIANLLSWFSEENKNAILSARDNANKCRLSVTEGAEVLADHSKLGGISSRTWRSLWEAAKKYSMDEGYPTLDFPVLTDDAVCVFCQQPLNEAARRRLKSFKGYVEGQLEQAASLAESHLLSLVNNLPNIPPPEQMRLEAEACALDEELVQALTNLIELLNREKASCIDGAFLDDKLDGSAILAVLQSRIDNLKEKIEKVQSDSEPSVREELKKERLELEAIKWVGEQSVQILSEIDRLSERVKYNGWIKCCDHTAISKKAGKVASELLTSSYIARFNMELQMLGASHINVELIHSKTNDGKPHHAIRLKNAADASASKKTDILSEGEKNIVGLAAFLADMGGSESSLPFIFDDPITSLDQDYEELVASRLVALGCSRQVIVFTHRLSFLSLILSSEGVSDSDLVCIGREVWGAGQPVQVPLFAKKPLSAMRDLVNGKVAQASKVFQSDGSDSYYPLARTITSDFRILLERGVEFYVLADIVARHRRDVNTKGKLSKLAMVDQSECNAIEALMTKYSKHEHSQSLELPSRLPKPDTLKSDIQDAIDLFDKIEKRLRP